MLLVLLALTTIAFAGTGTAGAHDGQEGSAEPKQTCNETDDLTSRLTEQLLRLSGSTIKVDVKLPIYNPEERDGERHEVFKFSHDRIPVFVKFHRSDIIFREPFVVEMVSNGTGLRTFWGNTGDGTAREQRREPCSYYRTKSIPTSSGRVIIDEDGRCIVAEAGDVEHSLVEQIAPRRGGVRQASGAVTPVDNGIVRMVVSPLLTSKERRLYEAVQAERVEGRRKAALAKEAVYADNLANMFLKAKLLERSRDVIRDTGNVHNEHAVRGEEVVVYSEREVSDIAAKIYVPELLPNYTTSGHFFWSIYDVQIDSNITIVTAFEVKGVPGTRIVAEEFENPICSLGRYCAGRKILEREVTEMVPNVAYMHSSFIGNEGDTVTVVLRLVPTDHANATRVEINPGA